MAYGLNEEQMLRWGLYVSKPLGPDESSNLFSEPALFLINPAGLLHVVSYSNASFARPDLKQIVQGEGSMDECRVIQSWGPTGEAGQLWS